MTYKKLLVLLVIVTCIQLKQVQSRNLETFMVNGENSENVKFYAYLEIFEELEFRGPVYFGGGTLITTTLILTVAQNVKRFRSWRAGLGANQIANMEWFKSQEGHIHEGYNSSNLANNLAIIRLTTATPVNSLIAPIELLPEGAGGSWEGYNMTVCGFGFGATNNQPEILQTATLVVMPENQCELNYPHLVFAGQTSNHFCAHNGAIFSNICAGDQGGPVWDSTYTILIGIQSFYRVSNCGLPEAQPAAFLRIPPYVSWIESFY